MAQENEMNDEPKRKFLAQFEASRKSIEQWPEWMRETAKLAYATLPRSGATGDASPQQPPDQVVPRDT